MRPILVLNSGSSSIKFQLIDVDTEQALITGLVERVSDHSRAFETILEQLAQSPQQPIAVGHRVVHGGAKFSRPVVLDREVIAEIESLSQLAPLHNPANLAGIRAAQAVFGDLAQVAVFDTAFHQTMPAEAYTYAIGSELAETHGLRKYGFHGSSHSYVAHATAAHLGFEPDALNAIILHLGNGASATAIRGGQSVETSMGFTPLPGLVMGTRAGDIDPALVLYLHRHADLSLDEVDEFLNSGSGLLGLAGSSDMRDVAARAAAGEQAAELALRVYAHRVKHYIGGYLATTGPIQALVFTAGVGENSAEMRARILTGLGHLGITLDTERNQAKAGGAREISAPGAALKVLVVPTNEELEIALQTAALI